jgi:hypothetical protein
MSKHIHIHVGRTKDAEEKRFYAVKRTANGKVTGTFNVYSSKEVADQKAAELNNKIEVVKFVVVSQKSNRL